MHRKKYEKPVSLWVVMPKKGFNFLLYMFVYCQNFFINDNISMYYLC